ncbi:hypothetical protein [Ornithinimicrobium cerasi]|uniref:Uncharacterized protein n=1 Tax=Ornithinimicrobium cerasi TaxID=2248773 RepID=A0A285VUV9_9MICO|nr:hypothetical protein [Ornithinimicrobium cerasi]SOC57398.1 hypothetical protein SAMN05421879_11261 [Ornithinimicrobium cerasi]
MSTLEERLQKAFETEVAGPPVESVLERVHRGAGRRRTRAVAGAAGVVGAAATVAAVVAGFPGDEPTGVSEPAGTVVRTEPAPRVTNLPPFVEGGRTTIVGVSGGLLYGVTDSTFWVDDGSGREERSPVPGVVLDVALAQDGMVGVAVGGPADNGDLSEVWRTDDGGRTWRSQHVRGEQSSDGSWCSNGMPTDVGFLDGKIFLSTWYANVCMEMRSSLMMTTASATSWVGVQDVPRLGSDLMVIETADGPALAALKGERGSSWVRLVSTTHGEDWIESSLSLPCSSTPQFTDVALVLSCVDDDGMSVYLSRNGGDFVRIGDPLPGFDTSYVGGGGVLAHEPIVPAAPVPVIRPDGGLDVLVAAADSAWVLTEEGNVPVQTPAGMMDVIAVSVGTAFLQPRAAWSDDATYLLTTEGILTSDDGGRSWTLIEP